MNNINVQYFNITNDDHMFDKGSFVRLVAARALDPQRVEQFGQYIADARALIDINPMWALGAMRMMLEYALYECQENPKEDYLGRLIKQRNGPEPLKQWMIFIQQVGNDGAHPARSLAGKGWRQLVLLLARQFLTGQSLMELEMASEADLAPRETHREVELLLAEVTLYALYSVLGWLVLSEGEHLWHGISPDAAAKNAEGV